MLDPGSRGRAVGVAMSAARSVECAATAGNRQPSAAAPLIVDKAGDTATGDQMSPEGNRVG